jgi:hypothetical protein
VPTALLAALLLATFGALDALGERLPPRLRRLPLGAYGLALAFLGMEWARWDHGRPDLLLWIGFVGAPVVVIFGGAAWGVRKWYGWPDLGPVPGRLAAVAGALVLGVLLGSRAKAADVETTIARGEAVAHDVRAWRDAHGGRWPATIDETGKPTPPTAMGLLAPPPFRYEPDGPRLAFPLSTGRELVRDLATEAASWRSR